MGGRPIEAGKIYVNLNIIGAVVGVQPFGGSGLSGTGPKAGGPLDVGRLLGSPPQAVFDGLEGAGPGCHRRGPMSIGSGSADLRPRLNAVLAIFRAPLSA